MCVRDTLDTLAIATRRPSGAHNTNTVSPYTTLFITYSYYSLFVLFFGTLKQFNADKRDKIYATVLVPSMLGSSLVCNVFQPSHGSRTSACVDRSVVVYWSRCCHMIPMHNYLRCHYSNAYSDTSDVRCDFVNFVHVQVLAHWVVTFYDYVMCAKTSSTPTTNES